MLNKIPPNNIDQVLTVIGSYLVSSLVGSKVFVADETPDKSPQINAQTEMTRV